MKNLLGILIATFAIFSTTSVMALSEVNPYEDYVEALDYEALKTMEEKLLEYYDAKGYEFESVGEAVDFIVETEKVYIDKGGNFMQVAGAADVIIVTLPWVLETVREGYKAHREGTVAREREERAEIILEKTDRERNDRAMREMKELRKERYKREAMED